jgi:hypothetical protein
MGLLDQCDESLDSPWPVDRCCILVGFESCSVDHVADDSHQMRKVGQIALSKLSVVVGFEPKRPSLDRKMLLNRNSRLKGAVPNECPGTER